MESARRGAPDEGPRSLRPRGGAVRGAAHDRPERAAGVDLAEHMEDVVKSQVLQLHRDGLTQRDIAMETGVSKSTVNRKLKILREEGLIDA